MLPLGYVACVGPYRYTELSRVEQQTMMALWTIFRSPLFYGGDMTVIDDFSLSLLTNEESLAISDRSINNDFLLSNADQAIWRADSTSYRSDHLSYFTVHNLRNVSRAFNVNITTVRQPQTGRECCVRDVFAQIDIGCSMSSLVVGLQPHESALYTLHTCTE